MRNTIIFLTRSFFLTAFLATLSAFAEEHGDAISEAYAKDKAAVEAGREGSAECSRQWQFQPWEMGITNRVKMDSIAESVDPAFREAIENLELANPGVSPNWLASAIGRQPDNVTEVVRVARSFQWDYDMEALSFRITAQYFKGCLTGIRVTTSPKPEKYETVRIYSRSAKNILVQTAAAQ